MFKSKLYPVLLMVSLVTLLIAGCATTPTASESTPTSAIEDTTWILESYGEPGNLQTVLEGTEITALFDSTKEQVRGSAGANSYFGGYQISENKLSIPQIAHTEMFRLDPEGVMDQESQYLKTLQSAESYQIQNDKLQINCGGQILIYTTQTDEEKPQESAPISEPAIEKEVKGPQLSDALIRGCQRADTSGGFRRIGLAEGEMAVNFTLKDTNGKAVSLSGLLSEKPVVMVFGSFT